MQGRVSLHFALAALQGVHEFNALDLFAIRLTRCSSREGTRSCAGSISRMIAVMKLNELQMKSDEVLPPFNGGKLNEPQRLTSHDVSLFLLEIQTIRDKLILVFTPYPFK